VIRTQWHEWDGDYGVEAECLGVLEMEALRAGLMDLTWMNKLLLVDSMFEPYAQWDGRISDLVLARCDVCFALGSPLLPADPCLFCCGSCSDNSESRKAMHRHPAPRVATTHLRSRPPHFGVAELVPCTY
jgi:hypothetical protein